MSVGVPIRCFFSSDLHGRESRYSALFGQIEEERPDAVFLGGDLLPRRGDIRGFMEKWLIERPLSLKEKGSPGTELFVIMGNDDPRSYEPLFIEGHKKGAFRYVHLAKEPLGDLFVRGYSYVPPSPFMLKDWERYDVSRFTSVGCIPPEDGIFTTETDRRALLFETIKQDLGPLEDDPDIHRTLFLFHAPPSDTCLDRVDREGVLVDHAPVDVHVGSLAIREFIMNGQPLLTMHGHIHESTRITGEYMETLGRTPCMNGANDGPELSLVKFDTDDLSSIERVLVP